MASVKVASVEVVDMGFKLLTYIDAVSLNPASDVQSELVKIARPVEPILRLKSGQVFDLMAQILEDAFAFHFITPDTQIGFVTVFRRPAFFPSSSFPKPNSDSFSLKRVYHIKHVKTR